MPGQHAAILSIMVQAQGIAQTQRQLGGLDTSARKHAGGMQTALVGAAKTGGLALAGLAAGAVAVAPKLISLASDAQETASKFKTVFGRETDNATRALDAFSKATGTSKYALREQAAQFQALIRPMGLSTKAASGMSVGMTKLATDLASFNNTSVEEAITALQSGLVGETEPLRKFGVQLSANRVQAYAYAEGIAKQGAELTAAQKAQASYALILDDTKLAQGDATKTAGSFANQFKRLKSQATDLATDLGVKLIPVVTTVITAITGFVDQMKSGGGAGGAFKNAIVTAFDAIKTAVGAAVVYVRAFLQDHREDLDSAAESARNIGRAAVWAFENVLLPVVQKVLPIVQNYLEGMATVIGGVVKLVTGLLTGDWARAWDGAKMIVEGAIKEVLAILGGAVTLLLAAGKLLVGAVIDGFKALPNLLGDAARWLWSTLKAGIEAYLESYKTIGKWVLERLVDGVKAVTSGIVALGGWIRNRINDGLIDAAENIKSLGGTVLGWIVTGFKAYIDGIVGVGGWVKNRISDGLDLAKDAITGLGGTVLGWLVSGFKVVTDALSGIGGWFKNRIKDSLDVQETVDAIKGLGGTILDRIIAGIKAAPKVISDAIEWLRDEIVKAVKKVFKAAISIPLKIDLPDIDIPLIGGGYKPGSAGGGGGGLQLPASFSATHQTGGLPGYPATDVFGPPGQAVLAPASGIISKLSGSAGGPGGGGAFGYSMYLRSALGEYFLTHFGSRAVRLGQRISRGQLLGTIADYPDRPDHIHEGFHKYAMGTLNAARGLALVGERGPELVSFRGGERVYNASDSRAMLAGDIEVRLVAEDPALAWLTQFIRAEIVEDGRQLKGAWNAGLA